MQVRWQYGIVEVDVPEHATLRLPLAGMGRRAAAAVIDHGLLAILIVFAVAGADELSLPLTVGSAVLLPIVVPLFLEWLWNGRTLGKRLLGLQVVAVDGTRAGFARIFVRNALRGVDFLPFAYLCGGLIGFASRRAQRLGDLVAGTVVLAERDGIAKLSATERLDVDAEVYATLAARVRRDGVASLEDHELAELLSLHRWAVATLARHPQLAPLRRAVLQVHGLLHRGRDPLTPPLRGAMRLVARGFFASWTTFLLTLAVTTSWVLHDPLVAYGLMPREMLEQIGSTTWSERRSLRADVGMTFFYSGNNLRASFLALGLGVLGGVPALFAVALNGALFGAVLGLAIVRDVELGLLSWVGPHGVPELTALMLCSAIGMALGHSWIRPGARGRLDALARTGWMVTPLALGAALLVLLAAPLEGFVAPLPLPWWGDAGIAVAWAVLIAAVARSALRGDASPRADRTPASPA